MTLEEDQEVTLTITTFAGLGDGMGLHENHKIFVPYTLAGELVRARIQRVTKEASYATLEEVITPSPTRSAASCNHFSQCGGCNLQHMRHEDYVAFKQRSATEAVRKAGFDPACVAPLQEIPAASRRRVELKVEHGKLGYYASGSHDLVAITECPVLEPALQELVLALGKRKDLLKLVSSIQINGADDGYDLVFESKSTGLRESLCHMTFAPPVLRASVHHDHVMHTFYEATPIVYLTLGKYSVPLPPGAFLQASHAAQSLMIHHVTKLAGNAKRILDLFAGIGTYSFPLAERAQVTAIEGDRAMVDAMRDASANHNLGNALLADKQDLFLRPVSSKELAAFDAVVINPPRSGAKAQCEALAKSTVAKIIMVSCNPATFTRDARILKEGGYSLKSLLPIDQFAYTAHLELVAEFTK